jgi:5-aminolevulinate synthase
MSKALAVQSARMSGTKRFTSNAAGIPAMKPMRAPTAGKRALHTTGGHPASLAPGTYEKNEQGNTRSAIGNNHNPAYTDGALL